MSGQTIEINGLDDALKAIGSMKTVARKAVTRSINRTASKVKTEISTKARSETTVKAKFAKAGITIPRKATLSNMASKVRVSGKRIPLIGFSARQVKKGVSGRIFKSEKIILRPRAFIATMRSGHKGVFWRDKRSKGESKQGKAWRGDMRSFYIMLRAVKLKYPKASNRDLSVRLGITELHGPALPDLIKNQKVWGKIQQEANTKLLDELDHNMNYYMSKLK